MSSNRETITGMDPCLFRAAVEGNFEALEKFQKVQSIEMLRTINKDTVLHIHITAHTERSVSYEFVERILHKCPDLVWELNAKHETILHMAARYGHSKIVEMLIASAKELGSEIAFIRAANQENETALHEAVRYDHLEVVKILLKEDPVLSYSINNDGETPLYMATERGFQDIVLEMLPNCKSLASYCGPNHTTALHAAVIRDDTDMVSHLLENDSVEISLCRVADRRLGWIPLHHAAYLGHKEIKELLLKHDGNTAHVKDKEGRTALDIAKDRGQECSENGGNAPHRASQSHTAHKNESHGVVLQETFTKKTTESIMIVATLVATVTFGAGITLPGGTIQSGKGEGLAVLRHNAAFKAFMITNVIAFAASSFIAFCQIFEERRKSKIKSSGKKIELTFSNWKEAEEADPEDRMTGALAYAILGMPVAFITGIYAALGPSPLTISVIIIFCLFVILTFWFALEY